ncbi:MAG: hypothetical protein GF364_16635 [Candidatus Lokiarchaeota archaeon]|nr:hypothetical protein [Candidatus Lokiarchaeota archaeon]
MDSNTGVETNILDIPQEFKSIEHLKDFLSTLEYYIEQGKIHPSNVDFIPIFRACQQLTDSDDLIKSIQGLQNSSEVFGEKIKEVKGYINQIASKDQLKNFLQRNKENEIILTGLLQKHWRSPLLLDQLTDRYLSGSFTSWTNRTYSKKKTELEEPEKVSPPKQINIPFLEEEFQESLNKFLKKVRSKLPITLDALLEQAEDEDTRYEWFVYSLHLIQKKKLEYSKDKRILSIKEEPANE